MSIRSGVSGKPENTPVLVPLSSLRVKQPYDALLVLDVEATCLQGSGLNWPNEIIEWPVCIMRWKDRSKDGKASQLEVVDEFRSFVRPTWRPLLSTFCTQLTGITQAQVNSAPLFPDVLKSFAKFLAKNDLIHSETGHRLARFCWCSDGPFDVRDFVVKQCFLSKIEMPEWLKGDVIDIRMMVTRRSITRKGQHKIKSSVVPGRRSLNIPCQLRALGLTHFVGREHSGIDVGIT